MCRERNGIAAWSPSPRVRPSILSCWIPSITMYYPIVCRRVVKGWMDIFCYYHADHTTNTYDVILLVKDQHHQPTTATVGWIAAWTLSPPPVELLSADVLEDGQARNAPSFLPGLWRFKQSCSHIISEAWGFGGLDFGITICIIVRWLIHAFTGCQLKPPCSWHHQIRVVIQCLLRPAVEIQSQRHRCDFLQGSPCMVRLALLKISGRRLTTRINSSLHPTLPRIEPTRSKTYRNDRT